MKILSLLIFIMLGHSSCHTSKSLYGIYVTRKNGVAYMNLSLNKDKSFVEYANTHMGGWKHFFGFYERKGNYFNMKQISGDLSYLRKRDTIIYNYVPFINTNTLSVYINENRPIKGDSIFADDKFLGVTNEDGQFQLPKDFGCNLLTLKFPYWGPPRTFYIRKTKFNQLFIMIYDYVMEEGVNFSFENRFRIKGKGLITTQSHLIKRSPKGDQKIYLKLDKLYDEEGKQIKKRSPVSQ